MKIEVVETSKMRPVDPKNGVHRGESSRALKTERWRKKVLSNVHDDFYID
jgi:hypothetical protein